MITCRDVTRLRDRFLALELEADLESSYRQHLASCNECRVSLESYEPVLALARRLSEPAAFEDSSFVAEVLGGVHQRSLERRLHGRRRWMTAAAAVTLAVLGGFTALSTRQWSTHPAVAKVVTRTQASEPAFVEVEGDGVRVYQLSTATQDTVQVAFIVDPHLEL